MHDAYKHMCHVLHEFDDPNVPMGPKERHKYRMAQLERDSRFFKPDAAQMRNLLDAEFLGDECDTGVDGERLNFDDGDENNGDDGGARDIDEFFATLNQIGLDQQQPLSMIVDGLAADEPLLAKVGNDWGTGGWTVLTCEFPPTQAALRGQVDNVKYFLTQPGRDGIDALLVPGVDGGPSLLVERMQAMPDKTAKQLACMYLLTAALSERAKAAAAVAASSIALATQ